jgi:hypothetical protein
LHEVKRNNLTQSRKDAKSEQFLTIQ